MSGWQKAGLAVGIGCASIVAMLVAGVVIAIVWARSTVGDLGDSTPTRVERTVVLREPAAAAPTDDRTPAAPPSDTARQTLEIHLEGGDFTIVPGPPGGGVKVEGNYAENLYELTEETDTGGATPRTTIRFRSKAPAWARFLSNIGRGEAGDRPEVTIAIPTDVLIDLTLRVAQGESRVDLGGLTLGDVGVDLALGNHELDFRQPAGAQAGHMQLNAAMGNISIRNLGNARATSIEGNGSMGNLTVDLGGAWQPGANADVAFNHSMGEVTVNVPRQVRLEADVTRSDAQDQRRPTDVPDETADPKAPLVRLRLKTAMGEGRVVRY